MDLEISRITDCASWHTVVGMEYSTVFNKCPSPVNWVEPTLTLERSKVCGMEYSTVFDKCPSHVNWVEPVVTIVVIYIPIAFKYA